MKLLRYLIIIFLISGMCLSCDIQKNVSKSDSKTDVQEQFEQRTKRIGDTVSYIVPVIRYKDTTIVTVNRQGTTLKTVYDSSGNVSNIDCFSSAIDEFIRYNKALQQEEKQKEKQEEYKPDFTWLVYCLIIMAGIVIVVVILLFKVVNKYSAVINAAT